MSESTPVYVGVSSCLLGQAVRFDGNHKHQKFISEELGKHFRYVAVCPEVAIGLGVPRPTIHLSGDVNSPRVTAVMDPALDVTESLLNFSRDKARELSCLSGYIFKKASPSCGMERIKVYEDGQLISTQGVGVYARAVMDANPLLPVEDEGRLCDLGIRHNFVQRVLVYHRWQRLLMGGLTARRFIDFHSRHKFLVLAHDETIYRRLGRLIASFDGNCEGKNMEATANRYALLLMTALKRPATRRRHANVLQHIMGYFKRRLDSDDKQELLAVIDDYRSGGVPLAVPVTLLKHYLRHHPTPYIQQQVYINAAATAP
jgi:uncharacterized protein YbgA (DUF1722 family)/uncharacterized protein YbbK (DUF523 family)